MVRSMTKSPVAVAREALQVGEAGLPLYASRFSKKDFTQPQLFAMLVLRQFFKTDYRGIVQMLHDLSDLRRVLRLKKVPHYSTLCYAEQRLLKKGLFSRSWPLSSDALARSA
ncbi:MAG TPA: transposase [Planctomycetota bacterium]|nr:transposase [Planctomycetota bacterium]